MKKTNKEKILIGFSIVFFFGILMLLTSCNSFDNLSLKDEIKKIKKNFRTNFTRSVYDDAIATYGNKHKDSHNLDRFFCKKDFYNKVSINGQVLLQYLPDRDPKNNLYITGIGKNGEYYFFRCYFKNLFLPSNGKEYTTYFSYINFSMSGTDFKSVNVEFFSGFKEIKNN